MRPIEILPADPAEAAIAIDRFVGFNKIQGMLRSAAFGVPTLAGVVIDPSRAPVPDAMEAAHAIDATRVLIRHDRAPEIGSYPQGGYLAAISDMPSEFKWYREQGRVVVILPPADPLDNLYSASALLTADQMLHIEVVGPGFDASDLNRGTISPLEGHRFMLDAHGRGRRLGSTKVDAHAYETAKALRLRKIALKYIQRRRSFSLDDISDLDARRVVEAHPSVVKPQIRALLEGRQYVGAPASFLSEMIRFAATIGTATDFAVLGEGLVAFSASQIDNGRKTVVWDMVLPRRKYALS
jgi:hypothetical protein